MPLAVLVSITLAATVIGQDRRNVKFGSAWRLVLSTLFGILLGLVLLTQVPDQAVKAVLAGVIILFSGYCLVSRRPFELKGDRLAWVFGFGVGVLGGAYGMNGPPLVFYGTLHRWPPEQFRATLQGYFLPASLVGLLGYWLACLWVPAVTRYRILSLPGLVVAIVLGLVHYRRIKAGSFLLCVHVGLIAVGAALLLQAAWR